MFKIVDCQAKTENINVADIYGIGKDFGGAGHPRGHLRAT